MNLYLSGSLWGCAAAVTAGLVGYLLREFGTAERRPGSTPTSTKRQWVLTTPLLVIGASAAARRLR
ncbi:MULTISPECIES: hypothetical protein [unclassified Actinopolyspora]|uniref:hypothetical protein n=1 Tax=unclassified Actinopolyspora TaxID=2639451 RepID=UPI0013F67FDF|nr:MULTISPECIES: hypothetical protein [unclassified Actinopolyspora]NHD15622.1 hypothetical protein [Actinopolyspora sp. BKK2]NHE75165.1 hypothetical protein [Actinopolyspora sp. BKK1]